jgi:uncharacterized protein (DUF1800 family)
MRLSPRNVAAVFALGCLALVFTQWAAGKKNNAKEVPQMEERKRALHALNRLTFGPRPGDLDRVIAMGVDRWIDLQLHPEKIDDKPVEQRLAEFRTLRMDTHEIVENFPPPQIIKAVAEGRQRMPSDPAKKAVYEAQLARYEARTEKKEQAANPGATNANGNAAGPDGMTDEERARRREERAEIEQKSEAILDLPPDQRIREIAKLTPEEQRILANGMRDRRDELMEGMNPKQRETMMALNNPQQVVYDELADGKLLRAVYSERQLDEVMTDFWFNHFNVFNGKGADRYLLTSYERDVIRPHAMGKFEDLLVATAKSPAMLFYLDNWLSVGPDSDAANGVPRQPNWNRRRQRFPRPPRQQAKGKRNSGLNENYGRELMELHTVGVNGGYTQQDVTEAARILTGWTLKEPRKGGDFVFEECMHEPGDKVVMGHHFKSNGEKEGTELLHFLATNPSTAKFISTKLAMRFVSDDPPLALVDRMAHTFLKKKGDIREVLKTMFDSPEFWAPEAYRAKVKTPLEFVASAVRATGADVTDATPLVRQLQNMGMPLYGMQPPTGYSMKAETWVNSSALLARMNFSLALAAGKVKGTGVDPNHLLPTTDATPDPPTVLTDLEGTLLAGDVSHQTHDTIAARLQDPKIAQRRLDDPARTPNTAMIEGLLLGSPEFQRR